MQIVFSLFGFILLFSAIKCAPKTDIVSVIWDNKSGSYELKSGKVPGYVAVASFSNEINQTG